jgi:DNA-binding transcriptional regulator YiaG
VDARRLDYGVWWSDEDECFIARALTLEAGSAYGDTPEEALSNAIALAADHLETGVAPVARPLSQMSATWSSEAVRALRRSLALTQAEFASLLNVSLQAVTHWEQGLRPPSGAVRRLLDFVAASPGLVHRWIVERERAAS